MSDKGKLKSPKNTMTKVQCPKVGALVWANSSKHGPRCTACGQIH